MPRRRPTVDELAREAETQLATMDPEASQALAQEHYVAQLTALTRALLREQLNEYVTLLLNPAHPFRGVISAAVRDSTPDGQHPETH